MQPSMVDWLLCCKDWVFVVFFALLTAMTDFYEPRWTSTSQICYSLILITVESDNKFPRLLITALCCCYLSTCFYLDLPVDWNISCHILQHKLDELNVYLEGLLDPACQGDLGNRGHRSLQGSPEFPWSPWALVLLAVPVLLLCSDNVHIELRARHFAVMLEGDLQKKTTPMRGMIKNSISWIQMCICLVKQTKKNIITLL